MAARHAVAADSRIKQPAGEIIGLLSWALRAQHMQFRRDGLAAVNSLWRLVLVFTIAVALASAANAQPLPRSVLIVDQAGSSSPWPAAHNQALRIALNIAASSEIVVFVENLDLGRFTTPDHEEIFRAYVKEKYRQKPIGVIVAAGSAALEIVLRMRADLGLHVPIVFSAVDEAALARLGRPPDVTGTIMQLDLEKAVTAARALVPGLKQIALVGGRFETDPYRRHFRQQMEAMRPQQAFIDLLGMPLPEVRKRVAALPEQTAIYFTSVYDDGAGVGVVSRDVLVSVVNSANRPIVVDAETSIGVGATGGLVMLAAPAGESAARLVWRVLNGESAASMPVTIGDFAKPVFDWRQLQRWNISEANLPPGSEVRFRTLSAWQQYRWQIALIAFALFAQAALITWLIYEHRYRRLAEVEVRTRMAELAHMNRSATAGELSASLAHEVNQPLAAIVASANASLRWLANKTPNLEEAAEGLTRIVSEGHRASQIVGTVRDMFKKNTQQRVPTNINDLIEDVLALLRVELSKHQVVVRTVLTEGLPQVPVDRTQLLQVILNLMRNAAEAMGTVTDRSRVLRVRSEADESGEVLITIEDSGSGIDDKNLARVFEPFFTTKSDGMGMGLAICRSIVEAHGGRLTAARAHPHGSVFQVTLPIASPAG